MFNSAAAGLDAELGMEGRIFDQALDGCCQCPGIFRGRGDTAALYFLG
jgi:hypothetical protein